MKACEVRDCQRTATSRVRLPGGMAPEVLEVCEPHRRQLEDNLGARAAWRPSEWSEKDGVSHRVGRRWEAIVVRVGRTWWPMIRPLHDRNPGFLVLEPAASRSAARRRATMEMP